MAPTFDTIIRGARIYDGSGRPPVLGDVGVRGDRIAGLGSLPLGAGGEEIDGSGLALAPGFIDTHTHDDRALLSTDMACKASQGVTTVVAGNCGVSLAPLKLDGDPPPPLNLIGGRGDYRFDTFADYLDALRENGIAVNAACLLGHSTLRVAAMDRLDRPATKGELGEMCRRQGCAGRRSHRLFDGPRISACPCRSAGRGHRACEPVRRLGRNLYDAHARRG